MAVRRLHDKQPASFAFTPENMELARKTIAKYPAGRQASAVISLLWRAQEQEGWVTEPAISAIAELLEMPKIRVLEVATFYTMFLLEPVGAKAHIQLCGTTPCWLRGADALKEVCRSRISEHQHEISADGDFSWEEVECLGACVNAPLVQVGADTYEDLTAESFSKLLDEFAAGRKPKPGPQIDRQFSAPVGGPTTLKELGAPTRGAEAPVDTVRPTEEEPTTPKARAENAARPKPFDTAEAEASRTPAGAPPKTEPDVAGKEQTRAAETAEGRKPQGIEAARGGKPDDLKVISGIGPKNEGLLHSLGIFHFDQIAAWTAAEVAWVDDYLKFKGRIEREDWIGQAKLLAAGGTVDPSQRSGDDKS